MTTPEAAPFKVLVVGSGLAGSLLANGLIHEGVDCTVFERLERHAEREGYQIRLGSGAMAGMRACLTASQINDITSKFGRAGGLRQGAPVIYDKHFNSVLDLGVFPVYTKSAPIHRGILRDLLADPVFEAGRLQFGKQFSRYEIVDAGEAHERVRAWFNDGSHADGDVLVGADGSHSKTNQQVGLNNIAQIKTHVSFIAKNELPTAWFMKMDPHVRGKPVMTFADKKAMFFCAYLPDKDVGGVDESLSSSMFGCQIPVEECPEDLFERSQDEKWDFVAGQFRGWAPEYHEIIDLVRGTELYVYRARASARPPADWRKRARADGAANERGHPRVWLLGDAMHAMLPLRGMGGNQALRDTATMLPLLSRMSRAAAAGNAVTTDDIAGMLKEYEDEMMPRAFAWVQKSGGQAICPADTSTWGGHMRLKLAGVMMHLAYVWRVFKGLFTAQTSSIDDVPELRD